MKFDSEAVKRALIPSLADILLLALAVRPFMTGGGFDKLLGDANLGLQLRAGDLFRAQGSLSHSDPFSFALPGKVWHAWEWLFDVLASMVHQAWGLEALAVAALAAIVATFALTLRNSIEASDSVAPALILVAIGFHASTIHMLARPMLVSWVLLAVAVRVVASKRREWLLVPLCAVWANLHGGFFTLPVYLGLLAVGGWFEERALARRRALLAAACLAASLVNPLGIALHRHILQFLLSGWQTQMVEEFLPPAPRLGEPFWFFVAFAAAAAAALVGLLRRRAFAGALVMAFFLWSATRSARHIPVLVIVAAPLVAAEWARWWLALKERRARRGSTLATLAALEADLAPQFARCSIWLPALLIAALAFSRAFGVPADFNRAEFPRDLVTRQMPLLVRSRIFTSDLWADYLIYRGAPRIRVWVSGNNDFFGPELGDQYLEILDAGPRAAELVERWGFDAFLVRPDSPAARWVRARPGWRSIDRTARAELFVKEKGRPQAAPTSR